MKREEVEELVRQELARGMPQPCGEWLLRSAAASSSAAGGVRRGVAVFYYAGDTRWARFLAMHLHAFKPSLVDVGALVPDVAGRVAHDSVVVLLVAPATVALWDQYGPALLRQRAAGEVQVLPVDAVAADMSGTWLDSVLSLPLRGHPSAPRTPLSTLRDPDAAGVEVARAARAALGSG
jgi:hypothetical protein